MKVQDHGSFDSMKNKIISKNKMNEMYLGVNKSCVSYNMYSSGDGKLVCPGLYYCYNPSANKVTNGFKELKWEPHTNKEGYGLIAGFSWMDGNLAETYEACTAWHEWLTCPDTSPWKDALKNGEAIHVLKHGTNVRNFNQEVVPKDTPYGYILMYHEDDYCQPFFHLMIALRCVIENTNYLMSWYEFVKMGYSKTRSMFLAYELFIKKQGENYLVQIGPYVDNFQFFMIDGTYNENRYDTLGPDYSCCSKFSDGRGYQGTTRSMSTIKGQPFAPPTDPWNSWKDYKYRKNVKSFVVEWDEENIKSKSVIFGGNKKQVQGFLSSETLEKNLEALNKLLDLDKKEQSEWRK